MKRGIIFLVACIFAATAFAAAPPDGIKVSAQKPMLVTRRIKKRKFHTGMQKIDLLLINLMRCLPLKKKEKFYKSERSCIFLFNFMLIRTC